MEYITNKCKTNDFLTLAELSSFATDVKNRTSYDIERLKNSIKGNGFLFPLFVWKGRNVILDGKARFIALTQLKDDGFILDRIPVVFVEAKDEEQAKEKVLQVNSRYGKITEGSLNFFAKDCKIDLSDLNIHLDKISFSFETKDDLVKAGADIVSNSSAPCEPLQIGGSASLQPSDVLAGNDGSVEQSWAESPPPAADTLMQAAESVPLPSETSVLSETAPEPVAVSEQQEAQNHNVQFTCPFCYSQFELTMEEVKELLAR